MASPSRAKLYDSDAHAASSKNSFVSIVLSFCNCTACTIGIIMLAPLRLQLSNPSDRVVVVLVAALCTTTNAWVLPMHSPAMALPCLEVSSSSSSPFLFAPSTPTTGAASVSEGLGDDDNDTVDVLTVGIAMEYMERALGGEFYYF